MRSLLYLAVVDRQIFCLLLRSRLQLRVHLPARVTATEDHGLLLVADWPRETRFFGDLMGRPFVKDPLAVG